MAKLRAGMDPLLTEEIIRRLRIVNVNTVFEFIQQNNNRLHRIIKLSYQDIDGIKRMIIETFGGKRIRGKDLLEIEQNNIISTGITSLDNLLKGGLHPGELYEVCGASSAGKTQLCLSLAINIALGTDGIIRYIDTKRDFSAGRIQMILEKRNHIDREVAGIMNRIHVTRATNIYELFSILYALTKSLRSAEEEKATKLIVIDSLPSVLLAWSKNCQSIQFLNHVANVCKFIANEFHLTIVTVNLITQWRDIDTFDANVIVKPVIVSPTLGKFWLHVPNTRILIEKLENEERRLSIWKSFELKIGTKCRVNISDCGVL